MRIPCSTYRLQFNPKFRFRDSQGMIKYLSELGISDVYASPIFKARRGSMHGYDVVDPTRLNPELGSEADFFALAQEVKKNKMGWLQDVIPNHMAFDHDNGMLMDVLEIGEASTYCTFFDIDWEHTYETMQGRLLAPFLGKSYGESIRDREIQVRYSDAGFIVHYYGWKFPLRMESYAKIFSLNLDLLKKRLGSNHPDYIKFMGMLYVLRAFPGQELPSERYDQRKFAKRMLWELYEGDREIKRFIDRNLDELNGKRESKTPNLLDELLFDQFFRLSFWKVASEEVNYRRFFNINELISVRVEDEKVFHECHKLILRFVKDGIFTGLRIDHIDGLYDPMQYLQRLQEKTDGTYVTVEKILALDEELPLNWQAEGTSGYDSLNYINGVFCATQHQRDLEKIYAAFTGAKIEYEDLLYNKKQLIIERYMTGDVDNLAHLMKRISSRDREGWDITLYGLKRAIREVLAHFPVYRTYVSPDSFTEADRQYIIEAVARAKLKNPDLVIELDYLQKFLLLQFQDYLDPEQQKDRLHFVMRFQQFTGPLMAKGFEDTTLYVYNRLVSLNEVGGEPFDFGIPLDRFHQFNLRRMEYWPHTMTATSTHDTKRSEDVRARINVLSEIPKEWEARLKTWRSMNRGKKKRIKRRAVPDSNDEYFFYQTLIGAYPFDSQDHSAFVQRIKDYTIKAIREAKVHTGWLKPDTDYEHAYLSFIDRVLGPAKKNDFLTDFLPFQQKVAHYGMLNSLSQTLLKITMPGIPDFYQGTELWSLTLVDPDNRLPVDFKKRKTLLEQIRRNEADQHYIKKIKDTPQDGRIKMFLTYKALKLRGQLSSIFEKGTYIPLQVEGEFKEHVIAFARNEGSSWALTVAPRFFTYLVERGEYPIGNGIWKETHVVLPEEFPVNWKEAITSCDLVAPHRLIPLGEALKNFPVALLVSASDKK